MVNRAKEYSAGIMSESSWFLEFKKMVMLRHNGLSPDEIKKKCIDENLFGMLTELRVNRIYAYLSNRLATLDDALVELFCSSDLSTQKIINLIAILKNDKLYFEFVNEVYREKILLGFDAIETQDVNTFFRNKSTDSEALSSWKETTYDKVRNCYLNFMSDANLLRREGKRYIITPPILDISLEHFLQDHGDETILKAITGVK